MVSKSSTAVGVAMAETTWSLLWWLQLSLIARCEVLRLTLGGLHTVVLLEVACKNGFLDSWLLVLIPTCDLGHPLGWSFLTWFNRV